MPKDHNTLAQRKQRWITELELGGFVRLDGSQFICQACNKGYSFSQKGQLEQHKKTILHIQCSSCVHRLNTTKEKQPLIRDAIDSTNSFFEDMCEAFVAADIPFSKIENATFHNFLEKYTKQQLPSRQTLTNYLPKVNVKVLEQIREDIGINSPLWVQVDETTDKVGRQVCNVIVGPLCKDTAKKGYLVTSKPLVSTNNATIVQAVLDSFQILWPGIKQEEIDKRFSLLLTDGVNYMLKAGRVLKATYPSLLHVTCLSHALNLVAENVRAQYPNVDKLLASLKKIFKKAPSRILTFKEMNPDLDLPPEPVVTRWGTWLKAAEYYAKNFFQVKEVVDTLDPSDAVAIETAQKLMSKQSVATDLAYISANFTFLCNPISVLEQRGASLSLTLGIMDDVRSKLAAAEGISGKKALDKLDAVTTKNPDLLKIKAISKVINGEALGTRENNLLGSLYANPAHVAAFKFAPLTTVDVERSFSMHKAILTDRRLSMTVGNLEMQVVTHSFFVN